MKLLLTLLPVALCACSWAEAAPPKPMPRDGGVVRALSARVSRDFSNAWHYNDLQTSVVTVNRDKLNVELTRLAAEKATLEKQGREQFDLDLSRGDTFDERTLEIVRKP